MGKGSIAYYIDEDKATCYRWTHENPCHGLGCEQEKQISYPSFNAVTHSMGGGLLQLIGIRETVFHDTIKRDMIAQGWAEVPVYIRPQHSELPWFRRYTYSLEVVIK